MNLRSRLTYANVVATLALVLALGGGSVYAASKLGKNVVKSKQIARGAVKGSDLGRNAVTGPKVKGGSIGATDLANDAVTAVTIKDGSIGAAEFAGGAVTGLTILDGSIQGGDIAGDAVTGQTVKDGSIEAGDLAAGIFDGIGVDVTGSATGGPQGGVNAATTTALPLSGKTTFTPAEGEVSALAAEGQFTIASTDPAKFCSPAVLLSVNGEPTRVFVNPAIDGNNTTPLTSLGHDADGPLGLIAPGTPLTITAELRGDVDCTAGSQLDRLEVRILQIR